MLGCCRGAVTAPPFAAAPQPDGQHPRGFAQFLRHQVINSSELQDWVALEWLFQELAGHCRRALQERAHIQTHGRCRQQTDRREHRKAAADIVRDIEDIIVLKPVGLAELA